MRVTGPPPPHVGENAAQHPRRVRGEAPRRVAAGAPAAPLMAVSRPPPLSGGGSRRRAGPLRAGPRPALGGGVALRTWRGRRRRHCGRHEERRQVGARRTRGGAGRRGPGRALHSPPLLSPPLPSAVEGRRRERGGAEGWGDPRA